MIQCPQCGNTVPATFVRCQFCGCDLRNVPRPGSRGSGTGTSAKEVIYYVLAGLWVLLGLAEVVLGSIALAAGLAEEGESPGVTVAFGVLRLLLGAGLLFQADWAIAIAKVLCYLQLVLGALALICVWASFDPVTVVLLIIGIALAGLQLWVLSEF